MHQFFINQEIIVPYFYAVLPKVSGKPKREFMYVYKKFETGKPQIFSVLAIGINFVKINPNALKPCIEEKTEDSTVFSVSTNNVHLPITYFQPPTPEEMGMCIAVMFAAKKQLGALGSRIVVPLLLPG